MVSARALRFEPPRCWPAPDRKTGVPRFGADARVATDPQPSIRPSPAGCPRRSYVASLRDGYATRAHYPGKTEGTAGSLGVSDLQG